MRTLNATALAKIATKFGSEPITLIEVSWFGESSTWYADRTVISIPGRILEVSSLDDVVSISNNLGTSPMSSGEITIKLDDTDGSIKNILDTYDVQLRVARVWQWFDGFGWDDKFLVFSGLVNSPIQWDEHDRSVSFSIMSRLEDVEIGFSAEEGDFNWVPRELVGKAWPMPFGTPLDYPALPVQNAVTGILLDPIGTPDASATDLWAAQNQRVVTHNPNEKYPDLRMSYAQVSFLQTCAMFYAQAADWSHSRNPNAATMYQTKADEITAQIEALYDQMDAQQTEWSTQQLCRENQQKHAKSNAAGRVQSQVTRLQWELALVTSSVQIIWGTDPLGNPKPIGAFGSVRILGGEDFPQNTGLVLSIGGAYFKGSFSGQVFTITGMTYPDQMQKSVENAAKNFASPSISVNNPPCTKTVQPTDRHFEMQVPYITGGGGGGGSQVAMMPYYEDIRIYPLDSGRPAQKSSGGGADTGQGYTATYFYAAPGTSVSMATLSYIVSIIPGTLLDVKAYQSPQLTVDPSTPYFIDKERQLVNLPTTYYTTSTVNYGPITAIFVTLTKPLSTYAEGWEDSLYITFESSIGPNIVDILIYLITAYTQLSYDTVSFAAVRTKIANFPANFPILERKNILQVLNEIAFQARCAIMIVDGVFKLKYLAEEPTADATITQSDIDFERGISVELTSTEDIVTRYNATWHLTWAEKPPGASGGLGGEQLIILRHNVAKYGLIQDDYDFYIYNQPDTVYKVATFWLIRKSNTWKRIKFSTFLHKMNLESLDTVLLQFGSSNYVSTGSIKAIVEKAQYNSDTRTIDFECLVPIKAGKMEMYPFFWPAALPTGTTFPTAEEIAEGWAGGNGLGAGATGDLPVGYIPSSPGTIFIGGINIGFGPHSDYGDRHPTDVGFTPKTVTSPSVNLTQTARPTPFLTLPAIQPEHVILSPYTDMVLPAIPLGIVGIDIHTTPVTDSTNQTIATFDTFFREVSQDGYLIGNASAWWGDAVNNGVNSKQFDFKYDAEGDMLGAGTAFLKD
jgi:hypothetical protein